MSPGHPDLMFSALHSAWSVSHHTSLCQPPSFSLPLSSFPAGQLYGLEKFWAFLKYSKAKNLDIDPKLQEYLGKFRRLEDFRVDVSGSLSSSPPWLSRKRKPDQRSGYLCSDPSCATSLGTLPTPVWVLGFFCKIRVRSRWRRLIVGYVVAPPSPSYDGCA